MINEKIRAITDEAVKMFLNETELIFLERVKADHTISKQYSGREVYELLQNIDDALRGSSATVRTARFELEDDWLIVSNNGNPFTLDTLIRLCQGRVSSKQGEYIGCKGIGFRSVLNWADEVVIDSGHGESRISVKFSREYASRMFDRIKDSDHVKRQVNELNRLGIIPDFPILKAPEVVEPESKEFDTVIRLHLKADKSVRKSIVGALRDLDENILLFLPNINKIEVSIDQSERTVYSKREVGSSGTVELTRSDRPDSPRRFYVSSSSHELQVAVNGTNRAYVSVAIPTNDAGLSENRTMYCFFPILDLKSPFTALIHATFCLTDNRNDLDLNSEDTRAANAELFEIVLREYVKMVERVIAGPSRLEMLVPDSFNGMKYYSFPGSLGKLHKETDFLEICRDHHIFQLVDGRYAKGGEKDLILLREFSDVFHTGEFERLVHPVGNDASMKFAAEVAHPDADSYAAILKGYIDKCSGNWTPSQRSKVFRWWYDKGYRLMPRLLKEISGKFITDGRRPLFLVRTIRNVPSWANISILADEDKKELEKSFEDPVKEYSRNREEEKKSDTRLRVLARIIRERTGFNIQEESSRRVLISPVNTAVGNDYARAVEFVNWLWNLSSATEGADLSDNSTVDGFQDLLSGTANAIVFNLPGADGHVHNGTELYFGPSYGNAVGAELLRHNPEMAELAPGLPFADVDADRSLVIRFFSLLGVTSYPKLITYEGELDINGSDLYKQGHGDIKRYIVKLQPNDDLNNPHEFAFKLHLIRYLGDILNNSPAESVIEWLRSDETLLTAIRGSWERIESSLLCRPVKRGQIYCNTPYTDSLPNFIKFIFADTPWIEIDGVKRKPKDLLLCQFDLETRSGLRLVTESALTDVRLGSGLKRTDFIELLRSVGVRNSFTELDSPQFYSLLLELPELSRGDGHVERLAREIYKAVIRNGQLDEADRDEAFCRPSEQQSAYFTSGEALAKDCDGKSDFQSVGDVRFSSTAVLLPPGQFLLDIPARVGKREIFKSVLNIDAFSSDVEVTSWTASPCDAGFQIILNEFMPCLMAYRLDSLRSSDMNNRILVPEIRLASSVGLHRVGIVAPSVDTDLSVTPRLYGLYKLKDRNSWLIFTGGIGHYDNIDKISVAKCLQDVFYVFLNHPSQDFLEKIPYLFMLDNITRRTIVNDHFGSDDEYREAVRLIRRVEAIRDELKSELGPLAAVDAILQKINEIDWNDLDSVYTQGKIRSFLLSVSRDSDLISHVTGFEFSFRNLHIYELRKEIDARMDQYKHTVYRLINAVPELQPRLLEYWNRLDIANLKEADGIGSLEFDCREAVDLLIRSVVDELASKVGDSYVPAVDYPQVYAENLNTLHREFAETSSYIDEFTNRYGWMLYFNDSVRLLDNIGSVRNTIGSQLEKQEDKVQDLSEYVDNLDIKVGAGFLKPVVHRKSGNGGVGTVSVVSNALADRRKSAQGDMAEAVVISLLYREEISEIVDIVGAKPRIKWVSGASKRVKLNAAYQDCQENGNRGDGVGYDIEVMSADGTKRICIDVKSSSGSECRFSISANEKMKTEKLEKDGVRYAVVFVSDMEGDPKVSFIGNPFVRPDFESTPTGYEFILKS